jgi:1-acyl-sn-glycerol-3-phosphate acyltransferase
LKTKLIYTLLLCVKLFSATFYRFKINWLGALPADPWNGLRLVLVLNHTSLYEPLFAGFLPNRFLKNIAHNGLVPVADKTLKRPAVGRFYRVVAGKVVPVTRLRDNSWAHFIDIIQPSSLVVLAPEGRMKRANGMDLDGMPMTIRGGVADLLMAIPGGRMLIAYSGGLHHVQVPNQMIPKLFKTLCMNIEILDIALYRAMMLRRHGLAGFKKGVICDLETRRSIHCPA